jgi:hypothetical protein
MNESAHGVRGDKTQKPEDNQDNCDGLEHFASPFFHDLENRKSGGPLRPDQMNLNYVLPLNPESKAAD